LAKKYFDGQQDILKRKRTAIGEGGGIVEIDNLPNNMIVDNQYRKAVIQKCNYLLGKPFILETDNKLLSDLLSVIFNSKIRRLLKKVALDAVNCGIGWLYLFYDEKGDLCFKRFSPGEIIPIWKNDEHSELDAAIRIFTNEIYEGTKKRTVIKAEIYCENGVNYYEYQQGELKAVYPFHRPYVTRADNEYNWNKIPIIAFKGNSFEIPLIKNVKSLQDALNTVFSDFMNNMQEDARNTILVIKNYDGENLAEFRKNLSSYGAVKVRTIDGLDGGVSTLSLNVGADNYKQLIEMLRRSIIENTMSYDAKNDRLGQSPNQINIKSMYNDIDLDANETETEFQASMEELLQFIVWHFSNTEGKSFAMEKIRVIFDRDMMMNEPEIIDGVLKSSALLSTKTALANHPFVKDVNLEIENLKSEKNHGREIL
jgi:SPP1 family phage portal protein